MTAATDYLERALLSIILVEGPAWVALYEVEPNEAGLGDELDGGSYARLQASFAVTPDEGAITTTDLVWRNLPACTLTALAIWDDPVGGNMLLKGKLLYSRTLKEGDSFPILAGDLIVVCD